MTGVVESALTRRYIYPTRIVWQSDGSCDRAEMARVLAGASGQATVFGPKGCRLQDAGNGSGLLLDFGRELHGGIQLIIGDTPNHAPVRLHIRFGESVSEAMGQPVNDHGMHDLHAEVAWASQSEIGSTGFRFVRIDLADPDSFVEIQGIRAVLCFRDLPYLGSFECSDPRLNEIWNVGAWTVQLNMQEYLWDGIKRDRLVWLGDMHPEVMVINSVFGQQDIVPRSLDLIRDETPLPKWMNTISSYSLWWILVQREWYLFHGDQPYLRQQRAYLCELLEHLQTFIDADGAVHLPSALLDHPMSRFPDAVQAGHQALMAQALQAAGWLFRAMDEPGQAGRWEALAEHVRAVVPDPVGSKQAAAVQLLAGMRAADDPAMQVLFAPPDRHFSPFFGYYVLEARAQTGDLQGCLDLIRSFWGGMLDLGATTFWEHFDLVWLQNAGRIDELPVPGMHDVHAEYGDFCFTKLRHSLCHGWSAGPTAWLSRHVLGIHPCAPGCAEVAITPHLGDLSWARGAFPTPHGIVQVAHRKGADGEIISEISLPEGVRRV